MTKYLLIEDPDGNVWSLPASFVASNRAEYFAQLDADRGYGEFKKLYDEEYAYTLGDDFELRDWLKGNFNWEHIKPHVKLKYRNPRDWDDWFSNAHIDIVTEET